MKCKSCGGVIEYMSGQGYFECRFCHSRYNATSDGAGGSVVQTIELRQLREEVRGMRAEQEISRLQGKAGDVQDKIDFRYVEFFHSSPRKAGSAAVILWLVGAVLLILGLSGEGVLIALGLAALALGFVLFFLVYKKAEMACRTQLEAMKAEELEPIFQRLRELGQQLEGGQVSLGYTESTKVPLRYCVNCHQNVKPEKGKGGGGMLSGINLVLTLITCGAWIPAWIFIAVISKVGSSARRAVTSGACPVCRTTPLFPARVKNV